MKNRVVRVSKENLLKCLKKIPVSINNIYGDPFIKSQIENTFDKLSSLKKTHHEGPISIITKANLNKKILRRLSKYKNMRNLIIFYTLTGLKEGGIPFEKRIRVYNNLSRTLPNVILLFRPIIPNINDKPELIKKIIDICHSTKTCLVYTGLYVDEGTKKRKILNPKTEKIIISYANKKRVKVFPKSACATKHILDLGFCFAHVNKKKPKNLKELKLLYKFKIKNNKIILPSGTPGDYNFIRFFTQSNPKIINIQPYHFLSFTSKMCLLCSSSWFTWADIKKCDINCWYCLSDYVFTESKQPKKIGCNPVSIVNMI